MTPPFVFDTSALFAHCLEESGYRIVEDILDQHRDQTYISAITWLEFQARLEEIISSADSRQDILACYAELFANPLPVTKEVVTAALAVRKQTGRRLPNADAIIAATAMENKATLVHRDAHLSEIPAQLVKQLVLPPKGRNLSAPRP